MSERAPRSTPQPQAGTAPVTASRTPGRMQVRTFGHSLGADHTFAKIVADANAAPSRIALVAYDLPNDDQIANIATVLDLHPLVVDDLVHAAQRPKLERYDDVLFLVVRFAEYRDSTEEVLFSEYHVLARGNVVVLLCQRRPDGAPWNPAKLHVEDELLALGTQAVVYAILDAAVDGYATVLRGLDVDVEQIEQQVFTGNRGVAERIYRLSQEVIDLQHAAFPLEEVVHGMRDGSAGFTTAAALQAYLRDLDEHLSRVKVRVTAMRETLNQILNVNATLVTQRQNDDMKKISGWAAIIFAPTLIGAIYGMNFDNMPELHWTFGYPMAVAAMALLGGGLWFVFKRKNWM